MTKPDDPINLNRGPYGVSSEGLTKRELFAAMAMQGNLANPEILTAVAGFLVNRGDSQEFIDRVSDLSVQQADALITALNEER